MQCYICKQEMLVVDSSTCNRCRRSDFTKYKCERCLREQTENGPCVGHEPTQTEGYDP
jgi:hypothetical protein